MSPLILGYLGSSLVLGLVLALSPFLEFLLVVGNPSCPFLFSVVSNPFLGGAILLSFFVLLIFSLLCARSHVGLFHHQCTEERLSCEDSELFFVEKAGLMEESL